MDWNRLCEAVGVGCSWLMCRIPLGLYQRMVFCDVRAGQRGVFAGR